MVLGRRQRQDCPPADEGEQTHLLAVQAFFDHDIPTRRPPEFLADHDPLNCLDGVGPILAHDHALAGRQPVRLDDDRKLARADVRPRGFRVVEHAKLSSRDVGMPHELLREDLAAFQSSSRLARAEDAQPGCLKGVHDAGRERVFGADDGQANVFLLRKADELVEIVRFEGYVDAVGRGAGISRAQKTVPARGDCASFQTSACSRPPLPITITLTRSLIDSPPGSLSDLRPGGQRPASLR